MTKSIEIDIRGVNGSGKANLLSTIYDFLKREGFNVAISQEEIDETWRHTPERIAAVNAVLKERRTPIVLRTTATIRLPTERDDK